MSIEQWLHKINSVPKYDHKAASLLIIQNKLKLELIIQHTIEQIDDAHD